MKQETFHASHVTRQQSNTTSLNWMLLKPHIDTRTGNKGYQDEASILVKEVRLERNNSIEAKAIQDSNSTLEKTTMRVFLKMKVSKGNMEMRSLDAHLHDQLLTIGVTYGKEKIRGEHF